MINFQKCRQKQLELLDFRRQIDQGHFLYFLSQFSTYQLLVQLSHFVELMTQITEAANFLIRVRLLVKSVIKRPAF